MLSNEKQGAQAHTEAGRRNTVKKYLRAGEEMPRYAKRTSSSKLDPYAEKLATWLAIEATKSRKQRRNLRQIHTERERGGRP
ncbi:hypothetical protein GmRootV118_55870 [Variovorax sp. V118]